MPSPADKRIDLILQQLESLPTLPAVAVKVIELTSSGSSSTIDVVRLIASDPTLSTRMLQLVHHADSGVRTQVSTVDRAVVLLGFDAVRSATLAVSVFQLMQRPTDSEAKKSDLYTAFDRDAFWKHCIAVGSACEMIAVHLAAPGKSRGGVLDPSEAFVCGLLHDLGKVALDVMLPKSFSRVVEAADLLRGNISDLERSIIGIDHHVVGKRLAEKWNLPAVIRDSIWLHGQRPDALPNTVVSKRMVNLITLADQIVREQHIGYSGNFSFAIPRQALLEAVGIRADALEEISKSLIEQIEKRAETLGLGQASTAEIYQQALAQANHELGRISEQLVAKNRKLSSRAKFFEALSEFQAELRPDAPPQNVLTAIGQTATNILDTGICAVFSFPPGSTFAETILVARDGTVVESQLIERAAGDDKPLSREIGEGPISAVGDSLEWMLSAISPRIPQPQRYWISLHIDGVVIGGVIWGAAPGESDRLGKLVQELSALGGGWSLALRTAQIREESRNLAEQLAETNRQLQSAQEEMLRQKTKLTVGEMAAGAAHEMNNPLAVISGRSQLLASQLNDAKQKAAATLIFEQSHRLSAIITELMDFAQPAAPRIESSDVEAIVTAAIIATKGTPDHADRNIVVTFTDVPPVTVDAKQVGAALEEILDNALQATRSKSNGQVNVHAAFDPHTSQVVVSVKDNGDGMNDAILNRAFDPFFSSQRAGRRRGMGLAKSLRWIESSGGSIRLESQVGHGTSAIILLPATATNIGAKIELPTRNDLRMQA